MKNPPNIYTFAGCPVKGQLGPRSRLEYTNECPVCHRQDRLMQELEYVFDAWNGEGIVSTGPWYAATEPVGRALEAAQLRGFQLRPIQATPADFFGEVSSVAWSQVPLFLELQILSRLNPSAKSPSGWWRRRAECPHCQRPFWDSTDESIDGLFAAASGKIGPPRIVALAGWDGSDIFYHEDPGPPLVTEKFVDVVQALAGKDVSFHPAQWLS